MNLLFNLILIECNKQNST